jgi:TRAP transporter TAXI family solute receptor
MMRAWRGVRVALAGVLLALGLAGQAAAVEPVLISIGTGGKTGVYYLVGGAICDLVNGRRWETGVRCLAMPSEGSVANLRDIRSGARTFGIVQSDTQHAALFGDGPFADAGPDRELRSVFGLFAEPFTVVARPEAGIRSLGDLKGKRVSFGPAGSGGRATMEAVMQAMGWSEADFAYVADTPMPDTPRALCAGEIDAAIFIVAHPNLTVEEMASTCDAVLVPVAAPEIDKLVAANGYYSRAEIPAGSYAGQASAVPTFALTATLVTSVRTPPAVVGTVAAAVLDGLDRLRAAHPALAGLDRQRMIGEGLTAPLHEGVLAALSARQGGG